MRKVFEFVIATRHQKITDALKMQKVNTNKLGLKCSHKSSNFNERFTVVSGELQAHLKDECGDCVTLCEDIAYNYETTIADLQDNKMLWGDPNPTLGPAPEWADHEMSVVHIFFGAETTVPKFRKRLYGTTDLIGKFGNYDMLTKIDEILICL